MRKVRKNLSQCSGEIETKVPNLRDHNKLKLQSFYQEIYNLIERLGITGISLIDVTSLLRNEDENEVEN